MIRTLSAIVVSALCAAGVHAEEGKCHVADPQLQGTYEGDCVNGNAQGIGHAHGVADYRGGFYKGYKNGKGIETWSNGDRYEGDFVFERRDGQGIFSFGPDSPWAGDRYEGEFALDARNGQGIYYFSNGDKYVGKWELNQQAGPLTAVQKRYITALKSIHAAMKPGTKVCPSSLAPAATIASVRAAQVVSYDEAQITLTITELVGAAVQSNVQFSDSIFNWSPCF